jgi:hypothetical protein
MAGTSRPRASLEVIAACTRGKLTGMIERIRMPRPHSMDDGEVIYALDPGFFQVAACTAAHGAKSNPGDDIRRVRKSLEASAFPDRSLLGRRRLEALWALLLARGNETRPAHKGLTADWWRTHGRGLGRKGRRGRLRAHSLVIRLSVNDWRRAF